MLVEPDAGLRAGLSAGLGEVRPFEPARAPATRVNTGDVGSGHGGARTLRVGADLDAGAVLPSDVPLPHGLNGLIGMAPRAL